jgi:hypothetical protein
MAEGTFAEFVERERARLRGEREAIFAQQQEHETKLAEINRELTAFDAYEVAKSGKLSPTPRQARTAPRARRGSKRGNYSNWSASMRRALAELLRETIASDRYPLSPRIKTLKAILAKLEPPAPASEPYSPPRACERPSLALAKKRRW